MLRRFCLWMLAVACLSPALATAQDLPETRDLERIGLKSAWWARAIVDSRQDELEYIRQDEQVVLVQSRQGLVTALQAETGRMAWSVLLGGPGTKSFPAAMNETEVIISVGSTMYSLNKKTGEIQWKLRLQGHPSCTPVIDSQQVYIGTVDGSVYAYDLKEIRRLFLDRKLPEFSHIARKWRYATPDKIISVGSNGDVVDFISGNGTLYGVDAIGKKLRYQHEVSGKTTTPIGRNNTSLFLSIDSGRLLGITTDTGKVNWEFTAGDPIFTRPRSIEDAVFVSPERGGLYCLDTSNGFERWRQPQAQYFCSASQKRVYAFDRLGNLLSLERETGRVTGNLQVRAFRIYAINETTDRIVIASPGGLVTCLHELDLVQPIYHKNPERRPILPDMAPEEGESNESSSTN